MSREVDQRVVEMQFNNADFEKNTKKTIGLIDKLMEKLQFKGAEKGFEKLDAAAEKVDFDTMSRSLDDLQSKFSALDIIAATALVNITNKAVNAGEKLVKSLSVDQIASGWDKYTEKTSNVQTIMNATGKSIDQVNGYLNKLMWYSDETSYSFNELTSALSTAVASGGDIEKMIPMVMGIANATADAGKTGFAFQSTIRNLMQSYSAGYLQYMDWKSLNGMGTGTAALKQELIDTAVELGTLKEGEVTISSFESTLSKKWANTKVMEKTFEKYASMMTAAYDLVQQNPGMTTSDALEQLSGQYGELAERAALAAQQATSFGQAIESTKDAVSSGWMKVFETLFGNKEEATATWTELSNRLYDIFVPPIDALNERMKEGLDTGWKQLNDRMGDQADIYDAVLQKVALANGAVTEEAIQSAGSFAKAMEQGGVEANLLQQSLDQTIASLKERLALSDKELDKRNIDREKTQQYYDALCKVNEEIKSGSLSLSQYAAAMSQVSGRQHLMQSLWNVWDAIAKIMGSIKGAFDEIFPPKSGDRIYTMAERLDDFTQKLIISDEAAEKIKMTFKGVFSVLKVGVNILKTVGSLAVKAFGLLTNAAAPVGNVLLSISAGMGTFLTRVYEVLTGSGTLSDKLYDLKDAAKQLLRPLNGLADALKNTKLGKTIDELLQKGENAEGLLGSLYAIGKSAFTKLSALVQGVAGGSITLLGGLGMAVGSLVSKLGSVGDLAAGILGRQLPTLEELGAMIGDVPAKLDENIAAFAAGFSSSMDRVTAKAGDAFAPVSNFFTALKEGFDAISGTDIYRFLSLIDVGLLAVAINQMGKALVSLKKMLQTPLTGMLDSVSGSFKALTGAIKTWQKNNASKTLTSMGTALLMFAGAMFLMSRIDSDKLYDVADITLTAVMTLAIAAKLLSPTVKKMGEAFGNLKAKALNTATLFGVAAALGAFAIAANAMLKGVAALLEVFKQGDIADSVAGMTMVISTILTALWGFHKAIQSVIVSEKALGPRTLLSTAVALLAYGTALRIIAGAVKSLAQLDDWKNVTVATTAVIALMGAMAGMAALTKKFGSMDLQNGAALMAIAASVTILAGAFAALSAVKFMNPDGFYDAVAVMGGLIGGMVVLARYGKASLKSAAAMMVMATSVTVLAGAFALLSVIPFNNVQDGMGILLSLLVETGGTLGLLSMLDTEKVAQAATAMYTISGAMLVLAGAVAVYAALGDSAWGALGKCAVAMGEMVLAVGALSLFKKSATDAAWAMSALAGGLLKMAAACAVFAIVPWNAIGNAAMGLSTLFGVLMAAGAIANFFPTLTAALVALGKAFGEFASGALKLVGAMAVFGVLSMFAGPICQAIINAAPDIQEALITTIKLVCNTIIACAEPIALALTALGTAAIIAIVNIIANLWEASQPALEDLWTKFTTWMESHNPLNPDNYGWIQKGQAEKLFVLPFADILDELKNGDSFMAGIYQLFTGAGKNATEGLAEGQQDPHAVQAVKDAAEGNANTVLDTTADVLDEHSPSKEMHEKGLYAALGLAEGLADETGLAAVRAAASGLASAISTQFCDDMQIHSPSLYMKTKSLFIPLGAAEGIVEGTALTTDALGAMGGAMQQKLYDMENPLYASGMSAGTSAAKGAVDGLQTGLVQLWNGVSTPIKNVLNGASGLINDSFLDDYLQKAKDDVTAAADAAGGKTKSGSKAKGKTAAEQMAEEYTKKLKANKYLQDALTKETTLWNLQAADSVTNEELLAKRTEVVTQQIELQADRVAIAQEQYDKLLAKAGKDNDKTKDAYATLLDEQASLEKLKASRYDDIWEDVLKRYENDSKTAEDEYNLWASLYEDTASVTEAANKKMEQINKKIAAQAKVVTAAEEEYTQLKAEFGEQSQKTQEAYRKYLEEQKDQQDLINELEKAQLEQFDNQIARYQKEAKIVQNRQQMLAKIYNDGDLSGREDAYKSAVEKYGEGSKQARQAALQGTMSSLISVGTAMTNMSSSLKQLTEYQKAYDYYVAKGEQNSDDALDALSALQSEQYNFVGFAENLADAFDMTDNGKKAMMQLGYTISKNWKPIKNGFDKVWSRVQQNFPETAKKLTATLNLAMSEGAAETASSFMQTIVAAMSGDYATAIVSGLNTVLNFMNTEFGKAVLQGLTGVFMKAMTGLSTGGFFTKLLGKLFGSKGVASAVTQTAQVAAQTAQIAQSTAAVAETVAGTNGIVTQTAKLAGNGGFLTKILGGIGKIAGVAKGGLVKAVGLVGAKFAALTGGGGALAGIATALSATGPVGIAVAALAAGGGLVIANWSKVKQWFSNFGTWMKDKFSKLWSGTKSVVGGAVKVGKNILGGLWKGVKTVAGGLWNGIKSIGKGIINGFKSLFGIHSPSTVFAEIGQYMMLGLQNGISSNAQSVNRTLEDVSEGALGVAMDCSKRLLAATDEAMEYQPTIQPLVDLSNVQAGAAWLDENLSDGVRRVGFDLDRSAQLADIVSRRDEARKAALWEKDEPKADEMSNRDIVEAIGTLGGRIDGVAEAVSRMKLSINGKKFVGGIINDVDEGLGKISSRNRR